MNELEQMKIVIERLRATSHGEWRAQETSGWQGPYPLPELVQRYFTPTGPLDVTVQCVSNPVVLYSFEEVNTWAGPKRMKSFSPELVERASPIVVVQGEFDSLFWVDGQASGCPVSFSRTGGPDVISESVQMSAQFGDFLLALACLSEAVGDDPGEFEDTHFTKEMSPTQQCIERFLPKFTEILGSVDFSNAFMRVFLGKA